MQFSFEYCIVHKDHKSEEEYRAIAVEGAIWPKLSQDVNTGWLCLARRRTTIRTSKMVSALLICNAYTSLSLIGNV